MHLLKVIGKSIEKTIRLAKVNILLRRRYGTRWPEVVSYPDVDFELFINPGDWRAIKKIAFDFARVRIDRNIQFWRDFVSHNTPALCLDIGANYGECLFSLEYSEETEVVAVEANTKLIPYLEKSRDKHPSRDNITIYNVAAADVDKEAIPLYVDTAWSGGTTALDKSSDAGRTEIIHVPQRTIDSLILKGKKSTGSIIFKLDVEGYEPFVLRGMAGTISAAPLVIGYIEIDTGFLEAADVSLQALDDLLVSFELYWPTDKKSKQLYPVSSVSKLQEKLGKDFHTDIVVVKGGEASRGWLPREWKVIAS